MKCDLENSFLLVHLSPRQAPAPPLSGPGPLHILELIIKCYVFKPFIYELFPLRWAKQIEINNDLQILDQWAKTWLVDFNPKKIKPL
jgi:hypothetical protein